MLAYSWSGVARGHQALPREAMPSEPIAVEDLEKQQGRDPLPPRGGGEAARVTERFAGGLGPETAACYPARPLIIAPEKAAISHVTDLGETARGISGARETETAIVVLYRDHDVGL